MIRSLTLAAVASIGLLGAAQAATAPAPASNPAPEAVSVYGGSRNIVGGARRNADGSVTYLRQAPHQGSAAEALAALNQNLHQYW